MKYSFYIGIIFSLFSACCYSQSFDIDEKYRGDPFFSKLDMQKLEQDCTFPLNYPELDYSKQVEVNKRCPLYYNFSNYFDHVYDLVDKKVLIYQKDDLKLELNKESYRYKEDVNEYSNGDEYTGEKLILSLIKNNEVKDKIILANGFNNETSLLSVGYQYYYIAPSSDIYTLSLIEMDDGIFPQLWMHYKIDEKSLKFNLVQIYESRYQITYPDNLTVLPNPYRDEHYKKGQFDKCLRDPSKDDCNEEDVYRYYLKQLKQKTGQLAQKANATKNLFTPLKKKRDKLCLDKNALLGNGYLFPYLNYSDLILCEIKQLKQDINSIEKELAK
ncbi:hypothetical protein [uncultured Gilliamella sp.]|uniref:hypothetical protein n=1 Tax=uncultured Gilliamella sp. TaxID=1193505 RepID=UPI0025D08605|nr:hypothetical protein [uncultured Gilliamella sp.]